MRIKPGRCLPIGGVILMMLISISATGAAPPLSHFPGIVADADGAKLQHSMIWTSPPLDKKGIAVGFRKTFDLTEDPKHATFLIFADARYVLWINGEYVDRGPSRFQPNGPQYDSIDVASHLHNGHNAIALLVVGRLSGGKVMNHAPGLTTSLEVNGRDILRSDTSWKWTDNTRFRQLDASWANLSEVLVDARVEDADWTAADYDDAKWQPAASISSDDWGPLTKTLIPRLRETAVPFILKNNATLPAKLGPGEKLEFDTTRIVQAYPVIEFDADADTELDFEPFHVKYLARAGKQSHFTIDTHGFSQGSILVKSGRATITALKLIERLYPYQRLGSFNSNDAYLNKLWDMCARSCEVLSEDSYVDCADRERVEWMDDDPPGFSITRTAMAGPGEDGKPVFSDPRLLGQMVRRTALTLQPDGWVKAHTCSDRFDIHAKMEDRACEWVTGIRRYYEATGDRAMVQTILPAVKSQMNYFLDRRTPRGLVRARDWVVWGNPTGYLVGEATTLNVFIQRALVDAAYLGELIGEKDDAARFSTAADDLGKAINTVLWDEKSGTYFAGYFTDADVTENTKARRKLPYPLNDHLLPCTLHANLFALDRGVVPADRHDRVANAMVEEQQHLKDSVDVMLYYYTMLQLYDLDRQEDDVRVLSVLRDRWAEMVASPWDCSWESFKGGSHAHIYGMFPGYLLSSYVLGVRWADGVPLNRKLLIEPHLGDLSEAAGTVVTEAGVVPVSWKRSANGTIEFHVTVPAGVTAELSLPPGPAGKFTLNGLPVTGRALGNRLRFSIAPGDYAGTAD